MHPTPTARPRHALRWVLGVGLVFVVVVGIGLQVARRRAAERWGTVLAHCEENKLFISGHRMFESPRVMKSFSETRGGNMFREWRQGVWLRESIVLRQERSFFGSSLEAKAPGDNPRLVDFARAIFTAADVELVVEP